MKTEEYQFWATNKEDAEKLLKSCQRKFDEALKDGRSAARIAIAEKWLDIAKYEFDYWNKHE